jgi:hypothetical protein
MPNDNEAKAGGVSTMPYTYIERAYGKRFEVGQRIRFTEYAGDRGLGVVRRVHTDPQYVRVLFDDGHEGDCHPGSVEIIEIIEVTK